MNNPINYIDPSGNVPQFGTSPTCATVLDCLNDPSRKRCEKSTGKYAQNNNLFLCIAQQETSFLLKPDPGVAGSGGRGGIGNLTPPAFRQLIKEGCSWLKKFKNYEDFAKNATDCEKAQAAQDYLGSQYLSKVGLIHFGPPYSNKQVSNLLKCVNRLNSFQRDCYHYGGPSPLDPNYNQEKEDFCKSVLRHTVHLD